LNACQSSEQLAEEAAKSPQETKPKVPKAVHIGLPG
jgi:hypothetical protein